jgi:molybdate/tungstate transport system substrate-binding protein
MRRRCTYAVLLAIAGIACGERPDAAKVSAAGRDTVVVYLAASLSKPLQAALDTFAARSNAVIQRESGGSLEHARKLTELGRIPDVIALADPEVFPQLLMPKYVTWYADFARNRMIIGYTDRSRHAADIDSTNWRRILAAPGVEVGRPDPRVAPAGYRTFLMLALAEKYYHDPGLAQRILANADPTKVRPNAAELAALLQTGEVDYVFDYESVAAAYGFHALRLPAAIDLGDPARASEYAQVKVRSRTIGKDSVTYTGTPILYALSVPVRAPHPAAAARLAGFLLSSEGRDMMRAAHVDALDHAVFVGTGVPAAIRDTSGP